MKNLLPEPVLLYKGYAIFQYNNNIYILLSIVS
jgi:hypothetical protein